MAGDGEEEGVELLAECRLAREGLHLKLDRGFDDGTYCVYVEFDELASRVGFAAAHRRAADRCALLKAELGRSAAHELGDTEDASQAAGEGRRRDLESTWLSFPVVMTAGHFRDEAMRDAFRVADLRTGQAWDQAQARMSASKDERRRDAFRRRLGALLDSAAYGGLDKGTKARLLDDVPAMAFPGRGTGR